MELLKDIGKSLNFQKRYDDMDRHGMESYDREQCKELRELGKSGAPLSQSQKDTLKYCDTIRGERTRAAMNLGVAGAKVAGGAIMGNPNLIKSGVTDAGGYVMGEAAEVSGPNDGTGQQLQGTDFIQPAMSLASGVMMAKQSVSGQGSSQQDYIDRSQGDATGGVAVKLNDGGGSGTPPPPSQTAAFLQTLAATNVSSPPSQTPTGGSGMGAAEQIAALKAELSSHQHTTGAKLRRSTRKHSYIKGNTRGFV